jgi:hypothetical protein
MKPRDLRSIRSVDCAVARYANAIRQGSSPCRADRDADSQTANFREAAERTELRAEQIRHILNERGVSLIQYMIYRNFGLHVDKLCRAYSSESLRLMVETAIVRWTSYGCDRDILKQVSSQVFGLDVDREASGAI